MVTIQILVDILERITNAYELDVESLAEGCSRGGTGKYEDMCPEDVEEVRPGRELVNEARKTIESLNLGNYISDTGFDDFPYTA